jgi:hypothetical protein
LEALGERAVLDVSPIIVMKAKKNNVEIAGRVQLHAAIPHFLRHYSIVSEKRTKVVFTACPPASSTQINILKCLDFSRRNLPMYRLRNCFVTKSTDSRPKVSTREQQQQWL